MLSELHELHHPAPGAVTAVAAWVAFVCRQTARGVPINDPLAVRIASISVARPGVAAPQLLDLLGATLPPETLAAIAAEAEALAV